MDRRTYIKGAVSIATAAIAGCTAVNNCENSESETQKCQVKRCEQCEKLENYSKQILNTEYTSDKKATLEELLRPETHDWSDGCRFGQVVDDERIPTTRQIFEDMEYKINSTFNERRGSLDVSVDIETMPTLPYDVEATVTVGSQK